MKYKVTPQQYVMLVKARDNWPMFLSKYADGLLGITHCAVAYLGKEAGLKSKNVSTDGCGIECDAHSKISVAHGIPENILHEWVHTNTYVSRVPRIFR